jgi:plastocyanin
VRHTLLVLLLGAAASCSAPPPPAPPVTHTVTMEAMRFEPASLTVKPGDVVEWVNKDPFPHTATAPHGAFDSREVAAGGRWSWTAGSPGAHDYVCSLHPTMKATLAVR